MAYAVLVVSSLLFDFPSNLPIGALPLALSDDGASHSIIALVMGSGMFAALIFSLPLGDLVDRLGRLATIRAAAVLGVVSLLGLAVTHGEAWSTTLMGLRSIALVLFMTAEFAYAAELASEERAVSDVATLGMIGNLGFATGPALGVFLWQHGIGRVQFGWGAAVAGLAVIVVSFLPSRYDVRRAAPRPRLELRAAWLPSCTFAFAAMLQGGVNVSLAVLVFEQRGIGNGAAIFAASAATTFALRYPAGRLADRFGPRALALPTVLLQGVGCLLAAQAHSLGAVIVAGVFLGVGWAAVVPVALGLLFEVSTSETRGAAMGAYSLAFNGGAATGAILAAAAAALGPGYPLAIAICAIAPLAVVPYVVRSGQALRPTTSS